jgi:TRAP transporter TAXI family solute receptor
MNKRSFPAIVFLVLTLTGLLSCAPTDSEQQTGEPTVNINGAVIPERIKIATASVGGSYYPIGNAVAQTLTKSLPGGLVTAENSSGSAQNIRMMDAGQVHFGLSNAAITYPAVRGLEGFEKPFPMKVVISMNASINLMVALKSSGIQNWADLKGKRIVIGPAGAGWDFFAKPIFAAHGVNYEDIRPVYEAQAAAMEMLTDGIVDAVFVGGSVPHATILSATASHELNYLSFDGAALDKVTAEYPFIKKVTLPAGTYKGMDAEFQAVDSGTTQLLAHENADPDFIYLIAKTIYENRDTAAEMHPALKEITPERAAMDIGIPYHEGSLRYFNEINIWHPAPASN